jgi:hypothetical protein
VHRGADDDGNYKDIVHVDIACERFVRYHNHHGGIIPLVLWEAPVGDVEAMRKFMADNRENFRQRFSGEVRPGPKYDEAIAEAMTAYDRLAEHLWPMLFVQINAKLRQGRVVEQLIGFVDMPHDEDWETISSVPIGPNDDEQKERERINRVIRNHNCIPEKFDEE